MKTAKDDVRELLDRLPDDVSMEEFADHLLLMASMRRGLEQARRREGLSQDEVERRFAKWLESPGRLKPSAT
jgi:hypothetical protein